jgi:osmotically-inducible protein OsmY
MTMTHSKTTGLRALTLSLVAAGSLLAGCAPILIGGAAVGGALMATDRRTSGTQIEDQTIELKASSRLKDVLGERGHVNVVSYNRMLLITGEVPTEADRTAVEQSLARIENVRGTFNELVVGPNSGVGARSNDLLLESKVKTTFIDAKDVMSNAYKVVAERGTVYLMGRVTEREANRGAELARSIAGVNKVVKVFEILSEEELAALGRKEHVAPKPVPPAASAPQS